MTDTRREARPCPKCEHMPILYRRCTAPLCEDGAVDRSRTDPIMYPTVGPHYEPCDRCDGRGYLRWCPECGADLKDYSPEQPIRQ